MSEPVAKLKRPTEVANHIPGIVVGVIAGESETGRPMVRWGGHLRAQAVTAVWMADPPKWSVCIGLRVIVGFEDGDEARPLLLALLDAPRANDAVAVAPGTDEAVTSIKPKVLRIESEHELILQCGQAKLALRADGRVLILGGYVLSRSKGVNKIKGGAVQIN